VGVVNCGEKKHYGTLKNWLTRTCPVFMSNIIKFPGSFFRF